MSTVIARKTKSNEDTEKLEQEIKEWEEALLRGENPPEPGRTVRLPDDNDQEEQPEERQEEKPRQREPAREEGNDELSTEEKTYKKRYGDLRRHSQKQIDELNKKLEDLTNKLQSSTANVPPTDPDQIKTWAQNNPQAAAIIRAIAGEQADQKSKQVETKLTQFEELREQIAKEKAEAKVRKAHPDFDDIVNDDAFHDWAESQPQKLQNMVYDNDDPDELIWVIKQYKREQNIETSKEEQEAARTTTRKTNRSDVSDRPAKGRFSESMVESMSQAEYAKYADAIDKAIAEGTFVYDLTPAAAAR